MYLNIWECFLLYLYICTFYLYFVQFEDGFSWKVIKQAGTTGTTFISIIFAYGARRLMMLWLFTGLIDAVAGKLTAT